MRGRVFRRGSTWSYVVDVGRDRTGRRRQQSKGGFRTRQAAQMALNELVHALQRGSYVEASRITVGTFLRDQWLPSVKGSLRSTTYSSYAMHVRCYLDPAFGHLPLQQLTPPQINEFYNELQSGWNGRTPLAPATVRRIHASLHRALRDAVRWQLLVRNPASVASPPRAPRPSIKVWTPEQLRTFLSVARDDRYLPLWLFFVLTGVRRGEGLALRWCDIDLRIGTVTIHRSLVPVEHGLAFGEPKTDRGRRLIGLDAQLVQVLDGLRRRHESQRRLLGLEPQGHDLVFAHPDGTPLHPESVSRWFSRLVQRAELPAMRLHDLRHLHATLALAAGVPPRVLADRLGHSTTAMTTDTYQHVLPELDRQAAESVAGLVFGEGGGPTLEGGARDVTADRAAALWTARAIDPTSDLTEYVALIEVGDEGWSARVPDLPGCALVATSREEAVRGIIEAVAARLAGMGERGEPRPGPTIYGAFVVRTC